MPVVTELLDFSRLLDALFADNTGYLWVGHKRRYKERFVQWPDEKGLALEFVRDNMNEVGLDLYFMPNLLKTKQNRKADNVVDLATNIWSDLDGLEPTELLVAPSILVESSKGHFHAYWRLVDPIPSRDAEQIAKRIAYKHFGADISGWDLAQILRIPGTRNWKYEDTEVEVRLSRILTAKYRPNDFADYPEVAPSTAKHEWSGEYESEPLPTDAYFQGMLDLAYEEAAQKGKNSDKTWHVMCRAAELGCTPGQVWTVVLNYEPAQRKEAEREGWTIEADFRRFMNKPASAEKGGWEACHQKYLDDINGEDNEFWTARKELTHIRDFARSRLAAPWAVLGVVLARVVAHTDPSLVLPPVTGGEASLNLFIGLVGVSGSGKGAAESVAEDCFIWPEEMSAVTPGSGQGIVHTYFYRPKPTKDNPFPQQVQASRSAIFSCAEIDTLAGLSQQNGSATLLAELRKAYMGESLGHQYADPTKRLIAPKHSYRMALIVGIQPTRAHVLLNDADGGTPQRFVWLPVTDPNGLDAPTTERVPMAWMCPYTPDAYEEHDRVEICEETRNTIIKAASARNRGKGNPLDAHALLTREKLATALALLNGRINLDDEDWRLASHIMRVSNETRAHVIEEMSKKAKAENQKRGEAEGVREASKARVVDYEEIASVAEKIYNKLTDEWQPRHIVRTALRSDKRRFFDDAIEFLLTAKRIEVRETEYKGAPAQEYRRALD